MYQGWSNYETWAVNLWISNDEKLFNHCCRLVRLGGSTYECADSLKDEIYEQAPELPASLYSDLLNAALSEVNWTEIVRGLQEDEENEEKEN